MRTPALHTLNGTSPVNASRPNRISVTHLNRERQRKVITSRGTGFTFLQRGAGREIIEEGIVWSTATLLWDSSSRQTILGHTTVSNEEETLAYAETLARVAVKMGELAYDKDKLIAALFFGSWKNFVRERHPFAGANQEQKSSVYDVLAALSKLEIPIVGLHYLPKEATTLTFDRKTGVATSKGGNYSTPLKINLGEENQIDVAALLAVCNEAIGIFAANFKAERLPLFKNWVLPHYLTKYADQPETMGRILLQKTGSIASHHDDVNLVWHFNRRA